MPSLRSIAVYGILPAVVAYLVVGAVLVPLYDMINRQRHENERNSDWQQLEETAARTRYDEWSAGHRKRISERQNRELEAEEDRAWIARTAQNRGFRTELLWVDGKACDHSQ
ncbi:hypothetical protein NKR19_g1157 [Coniochaeta hoffmannii]|uniref:Uncharacterized protein n=1 Tax=Coniochaeta hoffmannii TaxID=91930 RepID=A0AA38RYY5_9PEZI|nr:hypothetical protein NKR19_g1157 [Coniochaeta hoffmannii]